MRMKEPYEAYIDDYNTINLYMSKNFFGGQSSSFHLKDSQKRIIPLTIQQRSDLYNGYTYYKLSIDEPLTIGEEYEVYNEYCKATPVKYSHIVKTERFSREFTNIRDELGPEYTPERSTFRVWSPTSKRILLVYGPEEKKETALKLLKRGKQTVEEIAEDTGLSVSEVEHLAGLQTV